MARGRRGRRSASASSRAGRPRTRSSAGSPTGERCWCWTTASTCWTASSVLLERLLAEAPGLTVLATSRARLLVPFEWVFPVPGLSIGEDDGRAETRSRCSSSARPSSGVALTAEDRHAGRRRLPRPRRHGAGHRAGRRPAPAVGLDGLEAGLADRLRLLPAVRGSTTGTVRCARRSTGATRCSTSPTRRCCAGCRSSPAPFTAGRGARGRRATGRRSPRARSPPVLAALADQSLLVAVPGAGRHPLPGAGDDPPVRRRAARGRRASRTRPRRGTCAWCLADRRGAAPRADRRPPGAAGRVRRGRRRAARRPPVGHRPARRARPARRTRWPPGWPS